MSSLTRKYSNWQIYGFFGLFLTNTILTFYALTFVKVIPYQKDITDYFNEIAPMLSIFVGIPLVVSFLIMYKMNKHQMITKSNYFALLFAGFMVSLIFVLSDHVLLK